LVIAIPMPASTKMMIRTCVQNQWRGIANNASAPSALAHAARARGKRTATPRGRTSTGEVAFSIAF
jgi:hypothetical protein